MKLQTILRAAKNSMIAGKRKPHCFSDSARLDRAVQSEIDHMEFAPDYAEPGYRAPKGGVLFANWNCFPSRFDEILERAGYGVEWSDEWSTCCDCGKAVRISPDSYGWTSYCRILNECELVCLDCIDAESYLRSIEDNPDCAVPPQAKFNPLSHGYVKHNGTFETGFHPGQNANPKKILAALHADGKTGVVFRIAGSGQFDVSWEAFYRPE